MGEDIDKQDEQADKTEVDKGEEEDQEEEEQADKTEVDKGEEQEEEEEEEQPDFSNEFDDLIPFSSG